MNQVRDLLAARSDGSLDKIRSWKDAAKHVIQQFGSGEDNLVKFFEALNEVMHILVMCLDSRFNLFFKTIVFWCWWASNRPEART